MEKGTITITVDPISKSDTERYRQLIVLLIANGVFNVKNGSATLNFDQNGELGEIELKIKKWRKSKESSVTSTSGPSVSTSVSVPRPIVTS